MRLTSPGATRASTLPTPSVLSPRRTTACGTFTFTWRMARGLASCADPRASSSAPAFWNFASLGERPVSESVSTLLWSRSNVHSRSVHPSSSSARRVVTSRSASSDSAGSARHEASAQRSAAA